MIGVLAAVSGYFRDEQRKRTVREMRKQFACAAVSRPTDPAGLIMNGAFESLIFDTSHMAQQTGHGCRRQRGGHGVCVWGLDKHEPTSACQVPAM